VELRPLFTMTELKRWSGAVPGGRDGGAASTVEGAAGER
jgi:hypothetical protein